MILKSPFKTAATTLSTSPLLSSNPNHSQYEQDPIIIPSIFYLKSEYEKLFDKIYNTQRKVYHSITQKEQKQRISNIKEIISRKLDQEQRKKNFEKKFNKSKGRQDTGMKNARHFDLLIGQTKEEQNNERLNNFLMDHRNAVELLQQARLVQYYLKDEQKQKSKTDYLGLMEFTDRHRRTLPKSKERETILFQSNNQAKLHLIRKTEYIGTDKPINLAINNAKKNPTYLRNKNFNEIQYILKQDSQNLMMTKQIKKDQRQQDMYNLTRRLFLSIAIASEALRTYYQHIIEADFNKIVDLLHPLMGPSVPQGYILQTIGKIIKYKQNKVIHFEDFNEIINTVKDQKHIDVLAKFLEVANSHSQYSKLIKTHVDDFILESKQKINEIIKFTKIEIMVNKIYQLNRNKIIAIDYLSLRELNQIMNNLGIVPHKVGLAKFIHTCYWHQMRREGYSVSEFIRIQVYAGLELKCNLEGLERYLKVFNMRQIEKL